MKTKIFIILFLLSFRGFCQSVPNTDHFALSDVTSVVTGIGSNDLVECFAHAVDAYFDPTYKGSKNSLYNFRNYTIPAGCTRPTGLTTATVYYSSVDYASFTTVWDAYGAKYYFCTASHTVYSKSCQYASLSVGQSVYNGTGTDCTKLTDGWYYFDNDCAHDYNYTWYYHIESGVITGSQQGPS